MRKKTLTLLIFLGLFFVGSVGAIPNPAPIYCENMGYVSSGTYCVFDDGESCELWAFYNGECGQDYVLELTCKEIGESVSPGHKCCGDLNSVDVSSPGPDGICMQNLGGWPICIACGDGICAKINPSQYGEWENECNCSLDCSDHACKPEGYKYWVNPITMNFQCCVGIEHISLFLSYDPETGICGILQGWSLCSNCGNGICEEWEHACTCEEDCEFPDYGKQSCSAGCVCKGETITCSTKEQPIETEIVSDAISNSVETTKIFIGGTPPKIIIREGNVETITSENVNVVGSGLNMETSVGTKKIKILPKKALSKIPETIQVGEIELKEESQKPIYSIRGTKQARVLFIFPVTLNIEVRIDAGTGDVISVKKPWWSFLAW